MRVLVEQKWTDGALDYARSDRDYRVRVLLWRNVMDLEDLYFVRPRDWRMVLDYLREIGPREVVRKVRSRLGESNRNEKALSCGIGRVIEAPPDARFALDTLVGFVAPNHPPCVERVVLDEALLASAPEGLDGDLDQGQILYERLPAPPQDPELSRLAGWSPHSQTPVDKEAVKEVLRRWLPASGGDIERSRVRRLPVSLHARPVERSSPPRAEREEGSRPSTVLFGYGNYAKTALLPNVSAQLSVESVHELDPLQLPLDPPVSLTWDTSPWLRTDEAYAVYLIAGYHASHAPLAAEALRRGACAVVEKPVATTDDQLGELLAALTAASGRLFSCYQRRYSPLTARACRDLRASEGDPVSYHCIVYEVPLPARHWYRWPASGSRLMSNGCHWIDHFLYLNDFCPVRGQDVFVGTDGTLNCSLELENGAFFTMTLTERGSSRLGVRDHVELRHGDTTVTIDDNSKYQAEHTRGRRTRMRISKVASYNAMYTEIARRVREGGEGDSVESVRSSAGTVLALERALQVLT